MPQRYDRVQPRGLERREIAEDHPHRRREEEGDQDDPSVEDERHMQHRRKPQRSGQSQGNADEPPNEERRSLYPSFARA